MEEDEAGRPYSNVTSPSFSLFPFQHAAPRRPIVLKAMIGQARHTRLGMPQPTFRLRLFYRLAGADYFRRPRYEHILVTIIGAIGDTMASRGVGSGCSGDIPLVEADIT